MAGLRRRSKAAPATSGGEEARPGYAIADQLLRECEAMVRYASGAGLALPIPSVTATQAAAAAKAQSSRGDGSERFPTEATLVSLVEAHRSLSRLIPPATPKTALALAEEERTGRFWRLLGPTRLIRYLMVFSLAVLLLFLSLLAFSGVSRSPDPVRLAITTESNWRALWAVLYILSAAGLGAAFAALFRANRALREGKLDPTDESSSWGTIVLGLVSGVALAHVIPSDFQALGKFTPVLLALLGGFSAPAVYRILARLVETVIALVQGGTEELMAAERQRARSRATQAIVASRLELGPQVVRLQEQLTKEGASDETKAMASALLDELLQPNMVGTTDESIGP